MLFTFVFERLRGNKPRILSSNAHQQKGGWKKPMAHPHNGILRSCEWEGGNCVYYSAGSSWSKHEREICVQYATIYLRRGGVYKYIYPPIFFFLRKYNMVYFLKGYLTEEGENRVEGIGIEIKLHIFEHIPFL